MLRRDKAEKRPARPGAPWGRIPASGPRQETRASRLFKGRGLQGHTLGTPISLPGPHCGPLGPSATHLRPLSVVIRSFCWKAGRELAIGVAISRFSRAVSGPPTTQTHREPPRPRHPSPVRRSTTRLRPTALSTTPTRGCPAPTVARGRARAQNFPADARANGVRARSAEKEKAGTAGGSAQS